jgi:hypothetical protein
MGDSAHNKLSHLHLCIYDEVKSAFAFFRLARAITDRTEQSGSPLGFWVVGSFFSLHIFNPGFLICRSILISFSQSCCTFLPQPLRLSLFLLLDRSGGYCGLSCVCSIEEWRLLAGLHLVSEK